MPCVMQIRLDHLNEPFTVLVNYFESLKVVIDNTQNPLFSALKTEEIVLHLINYVSKAISRKSLL